MVSAAGFPLDPIWYTKIRNAHKLGISKTLTYTAALSTLQHSIFERKQPHHHAFDQAKMGFTHPLSDHLTELNALRAFEGVKRENRQDLDDWCYRMFLSRRSLEAALVAQQEIESFMAKSLGEPLKFVPTLDPKFNISFRMALAQGLHTKAALLVDDHRFDYQPLYYPTSALADTSSVMFGFPSQWVVFNTVRLGDKGIAYAVTLTAIDPSWILGMPLFSKDALSDRVAQGIMSESIRELIITEQNRIAGTEMTTVMDVD
jgi:hypothetical protein